MKSVWFVTASILCVVGCSTIPEEERPATRAKIQQNAAETLATLTEQFPELTHKLDLASGYMVVSGSAIKVPLLGSGSGNAVLYDKNNATRTYYDVGSYDLGIGFADAKYQGLVLFESDASLKSVQGGAWDYKVSNDWTVKRSESYRDGVVNFNGYELPTYMRTESDGSLTSSARVITVSVNDDLTDTGVSDISFPMKYQHKKGEQEKDVAPRQWNRVLPFLGQKVIDEGYDLPLPIGVSITYANVFQYMDINDLEVGFDGGDKKPIDFVQFSDNSSTSESPQLTLDAWLFPFMNVFVSFGKIEGDASVHFGFNGDDLLDQLEVDCSGVIQNPLCRFEGEESVPIRVDVEFDGYSYSGGMVLAGGWESYFIAIPMTYTYADMSSSDTTGLVFSTMPRVGKVFSLSKNKSLALYGGMSYIDSELTISGTHYFGDTGASVDYKIKQSNPDKYAGFVGGNFTLDKHWSLVFEYSGLGTPRDQWLSSMKFRF